VKRRIRGSKSHRASIRASIADTVVKIADPNSQVVGLSPYVTA
jgi:hypothetical protein